MHGPLTVGSPVSASGFPWGSAKKFGIAISSRATWYRSGMANLFRSMRRFRFPASSRGSVKKAGSMSPVRDDPRRRRRQGHRTVS